MERCLRSSLAGWFIQHALFLPWFPPQPPPLLPLMFGHHQAGRPPRVRLCACLLCECCCSSKLPPLFLARATSYVLSCCIPPQRLAGHLGHQRACVRLVPVICCYFLHVHFHSWLVIKQRTCCLQRLAGVMSGQVAASEARSRSSDGPLVLVVYIRGPGVHASGVHLSLAPKNTCISKHM
jgi:hypothetical protein